ncbi:hypothetical protein [Asanoa siamensis]|uniref:Uncharacterized protein n=1 Tax=Asanoa siamensis TaxID=926357 RepID=A0ABQ4D108_9ACTN|nr:hypothetical protein [Asanoa siamensis]GIF77200.1 hypothetical protein Asi02nite_67180 [Asanoa siamensis]
MQGDPIVWYEILEPFVVRTRDGGPIRDDYSNVSIEGTGRMRAHAGNTDRRPPCIPVENRALPSHDPWDRQLPPAIARCVTCAATHLLDGT